MKKQSNLVILGLVSLSVTLGTVFGMSITPLLSPTHDGSYTSVANQLTANVPNANTADLRGAHSYHEITDTGILYTSSIYSFTLTLPTTWEAIHETVSDGPTDAFVATVKLSSVADPSSYVEIYVIKSAAAKDPAVSDLPAVKVGEISNRYVYYLGGAGDRYGAPGVDGAKDKAHSEETQAIRASFATAI